MNEQQTLMICGFLAIIAGNTESNSLFSILWTVLASAMFLAALIKAI